MKDRTVKEEIIEFDNLYKAMTRCKKNVMWKDSVAGYVQNGLANVHKLRKNLENDTYKIDRYTCFKIYEPKERDIVSTRIKDRVFQRAFCDRYFYNAVTRSFIYDNCACQVGKGNEFARKRLATHLRKFYAEHGTDGYILKTDIKDFFGTTKHSVAFAAISKNICDEWARGVVKNVISSFDQGAICDVGLGLGSEMTQIIELAVLNGLDHYIKEWLRIEHYVRYNDDMIMIHESKERLRECNDHIGKALGALELKQHPKKTQIFKVSQGVKFLGFRFRLTESGHVSVTLLPEKVSKERRKLKHIVERVKLGLMTKADADKSYASWRSYVSNHHKRGTKRRKVHRDTHSLVLAMDKYYESLWEE